MSTEPSRTAQLRQRLENLHTGDESAANALIDDAYDSLRRIASEMLHSFPCVGRWEETDDVWQAAALKLHQSLAKTRPESVSHFLHLAGWHIRRTLIEFARKHNGPLGLNANHDTDGPSDSSTGDGEKRPAVADGTNDPVNLAEWAEFHEQIERLPDDAREVFDLIWYGGLSQADAAEVLEVDPRTVRRRWRQARLVLSALRSGQPLG